MNKINGKLTWMLENIDYFGSPYNLNFKGDSTFRTWFGGIVSFIIYVLTFTITISNSLAMVTRTGPTSNSQNLYETNATLIDLSKREIIFIIKVLDSNLQLIDYSSILNI